MSRIGFDYGVAPRPETGYRSAEVCLNGHLISGDIEHEAELTAKFCAECGAETIRVCPNCTASIRGDRVIDGSPIYAVAPPPHCHGCGSGFPWTIAKIAAAKELAAEIEGLDEGERKQLQQVIDDLIAGGSRTELAASRLKRFMKKAGLAVGQGLYKVVVDVVSEAAKKAITNL